MIIDSAAEWSASLNGDWEWEQVKFEERSQLVGFARLLKNRPYLCAHVKVIEISDSKTILQVKKHKKWQLLATFPLMFARKLPAVHRIYLDDGPLHTTPVSPCFHPSLAEFASISTVVVRDLTFMSVHPFVRLLLSMPGLRDLTCDGLRWPQHDVERSQLPLQASSPQLCVLRLLDNDVSPESTRNAAYKDIAETFDIMTICHTLAEFHLIAQLELVHFIDTGLNRLVSRPESRLRALSLSLSAGGLGVYDIDQPDLHDWGVQADTQVLSHDLLIRQSQEANIDLSKQTDLEEFHLTVGHLDIERSCTWVAVLLKQLELPRLRQCSLRLVSPSDAVNVLARVSLLLSPALCASIDAALTSLPSMTLQHVQLRIEWYTHTRTGSPQERSWRMQLMSRFPALSNRGVLAIHISLEDIPSWLVTAEDHT
ncbi:hypothetical protein POSPLADRAFT_1047444 [Postia placenta MAD-698-R-SB12]|uniref:F-box domain-containing protein n=1 Tax=Postia placenta MAD-698-R-SB12 TaxID=670580 RepID=A0A1X6MXY0_9APHY|nr:hypothetical protein POSPLADRAFT_1047444 [Postia placenta MAD-698-R-SB12]OSX61197.1 hypothetical protein POSPLADRAFT_1047444 [Postia placenta MAD-698-R-SB12]